MPETPPRLIAHLDMDAFYASVELLRYPELHGRAVAIGGGSRHRPTETIDPVTGASIRSFSTLHGYVGRGVITTATYEARALGLHSAMSLARAAALAPEAVLLPVDFDEYRKYSRLFKAAVRDIAADIEDRGIDEIYIDLTSLIEASAAEADVWSQARGLARSIKQAVRAATGLSCSIAVAPNKLLAKIASDLDKPDGLTIVTEADIERRIWPLPVRKINGVGPKTNSRLESLGIRTIGELAQAQPDWLVQQFGSHHGAWLHDAAHGRDVRPVVTYSEPKSISRETTFEHDLHPARDRDRLSLVFTDLCRAVSDDLRRKGYVSRTIGVKLRYDNFRTLTRDHTIAEPTDDPDAIRRAAAQCLKRAPLERRIRLLGVKASALLAAVSTAAPVRAAEPPPTLFD